MKRFDAIRQDIAEYLAKNHGIALDSIAPESTLEDIGMDSLGVLGVATLLENKHGLVIESASMARLQTFADLIELVKAKAAELP
jgi:acyl carrier protein